MKSIKQNSALILMAASATLAGCASNMADIPREQKLAPVVVYVESCGNYQLDGTLSKYVWDTVEIKYENRRRRMNQLLNMCNKFNASIASAISAEGINARIVSVTTEEPPTQEVRDRDAVALGATYALYVGKPIFKSILQSSGQRPLTIVAYDLNLYRVGRNKPIGTGEANDLDASIAANRVAHTLVERCNPSFVYGCANGPSYGITGTVGG
ncbi:hypothetical protein [Burkholderia seminalis]|uniref:hypothetical protein n=1 Tax=Burkholderia seminalis TaxID=488731 RepID=UPI002654C4B6|nr:hypothetical protein [Burkholderia seminalis]MDN7849952.1 hypothetical protein [Burkholderia seminalis]